MSRFEDFGLPDTLLRGIYSKGWEHPSDIQAQGIQAIKTGSDVILQAQSGKGKTGAFTISVLNQIDPEVEEIQAVIILPTIELGKQVYEVAIELSQYMDINVVKCVGGDPLPRRLTAPGRACILVGTGGKLLDTLLRQESGRYNVLPKYNPRLVVIDEFDRTLESNHKHPEATDAIKNLMKSWFSPTVQMVFCSATTNPTVMEFAKRYFRTDPEPVHILIEEEALNLKGIEQFYVEHTRQEEKFDTIIDIFKIVPVAQSVVFVNSKAHCDQLETQFRQHHYPVMSIHGDMDKSTRSQIMDDFRCQKFRILLSTDLTSRGIDVPSVSMVINYDIPKDPHTYIHRVGRTGRHGKTGVAINLVSSDQHDWQSLQNIGDRHKIVINSLPGNFAELVK